MKKIKIPARLKKRMSDYLARRPHRSFKRTRTRDMPKVASLPGYVAFSLKVWRIVHRYRKQMILFGVVFILMNLLVIGFVQQDNYQKFLQVVKSLSTEIFKGEADKTTEAFTLVGIALTGGLTGSLSEAQQLSLAFTAALMWLSVVWFLRQRLAGNEVTVRDAIYSSGSPLVPSLVIMLVGIVQLLPAALAVILYASALGTGALSGVESMMFGLAAGLGVVLSLYWVSSTFFAAVIVTLQGTYPFKALRLAGDIVLGHRVPLLLRLLWLLVWLALLWLVVLLPIVLFSSWVNVAWLPIVPLAIQGMTALSLVYIVTYIYLLYREMLNDPVESN